MPDHVYERLKASAEQHRRSLNSEAIVCLESVLAPVKIAPEERLARARRLRDSLGTQFLADDIDVLKEDISHLSPKIALDSKPSHKLSTS
ncbi:FitA-like ribbon-helix-helix domain-containing protein [Chitinimonas arctica]|uniref:FitA-like ribbon-helix-helix domain-containing protein n=1 Tax=Chitinimonas arctica TaxID=2594795 RepID=UPI003570D81C